MLIPPFSRSVPLFLALVAIPAVAADSGLVVTVTGGQIRGTALDAGGAAFKGIPYARPPVGPLRWREPAPLQSWTGVRDAKEFGPLCAQNSYFIQNAKEISKEDCLYLNVLTPDATSWWSL